MMTSLSGTVSRMLREVMFASGVWYCVLLCVSQALGALDISLAVMVGLSTSGPEKSRFLVLHKLFLRFLDRLPVQRVRVLRRCSLIDVALSCPPCTVPWYHA
mgnify:CR=1 FL=1